MAGAILEPTLARDHSLASALRWGIFLGVSWTWCIGMFLPVLIARDFGLIGWFVFAIPNVLGAAAMGIVLPNAQASERMVQRHATACIWFSIVTLVFQLFFILWMLSWFSPWFAAIPIIATLLIGLLAARQRRGPHLASAIVLGISLVIALAMGVMHKLGPIASARPIDPPLVALAMVCVLGFLLCPYLDLTFHQARAATGPKSGAIAFLFGFGIVFCSMIVFTLGYAPLFLTRRAELTGFTALLLATHLLAQLSAKWILHDRAMAELVARVAMPRSLRQPRWILAAAAIALPLLTLVSNRVYHGLSLGEITYRLFLAFYGLVFPAYVWLFIVRPYADTARAKRVYAITLLAAAPFYWIGFIEQKMNWLPIGVAIVLASKVFLALFPKAVRLPAPAAIPSLSSHSSR